jgi:hypothetical protein
MKAPLAVAALLILTLGPALAQDDEAIDVSPGPSHLELSLMTKGEQLMDQGDISGARKALLPAANHGAAEALRCLAQTYDPKWLADHNVVGLEGLTDLGKAAELYAKAKAAGDKIAAARFPGDR